jgi:hypothetical protein
MSVEINDLEKVIVKVNGGSGIVLNFETDKRSYVLTAYHNIETSIDNNETIELLNDTNHSYSSIGAPYCDTTNDFSLIEINFIFDIPNIKYDATIQPNDVIIFMGYPDKADGKRKILNGTVIEWNSKTAVNVTENIQGSFVVKEKTIEVIAGFSGSGVFKKNGQKLSLIGILKSLPEEEFYYKEISCVPINNILEFMKKNNLPKLSPLRPFHTFSYIKYVEQLTENSKVFPDPELVDFIAFSRYEEALLKELVENFTTKKNYMALLVGNPSSGKTIFAYELGMNIREVSEANNVYYIDIALAKNDITADITSMFKCDQNSYFIIDNVHLDSELACNIYDTLYDQKIKILFIGRDIDRKFFNQESIEDIYRKFEPSKKKENAQESEERFYRLKNFNEKNDKESILEKTKSIITAFKNTYAIPSEIGDDTTIAQMIGDNFILLYYYLQYWKESPTAIFTSLDKSKLLKKIWIKIKNDLDSNEENLKNLVNIAILYQYEICAHQANKAVLSKKGLTKFDEKSEVYEESCSLYHANYAKLVIDAYCETLEFKKTKQTLEELTITHLKKHFENNYEDISLSDELVKLRNNNENGLLTNLLKALDKETLQTYCLTPNTRTTLKKFTKLFNLLINFGQKELAENILCKLIINEFSTYELDIISLIHLYNIIYKRDCDTKIIDSLKKLIKEKQKNIRIGDTHLGNIGNSFIVLNKSDRNFSIEVYKNLNLETLIQLAKDSSTLVSLGNGLITLKTINKDKTAEIYEALDLETLIQLAKDSSTLVSLGTGLNNLFSIDTNKTTNFYKNLKTDDLIQLAKDSSTLVSLGTGLNNLNTIDKDKTAEIYEALDLEALIQIAKKNLKFKILNNGISNLMKINKDKTTKLSEVLKNQGILTPSD